MAVEKAAETERREDKKIVGNIDRNIADLETVIEGITYPLTISINGEWGAGKTVFLKEWEKNKPNNSIYIDAFATDFIDTPLAVILSEFTTHYKDSPFFEELLNTKVDYSKLTKNGFSEVIKVITAALTKGEASLDLKGLLEGATSASKAEKNIAYVSDMKEIIESFKDEIKKVANDERLYIFVDELDRCRPTYAVEFIEIVKHFFEIDNTVFIFAINRKELVSSIKHVQGCADEDRYLKKFFNLNFDLPPLPTREFIELLINDEEKTLGLSKKYLDSEFVDNFTYLCMNFNLVARDIEQIFLTVLIAMKKHKDESIKLFMHPFLLMAVLRDEKIKKEKYYNYLIEKNKDPSFTYEWVLDLFNKKGEYYESLLTNTWLRLIKNNKFENCKSICDYEINQLDNDRFSGQKSNIFNLRTKQIQTLLKVQSNVDTFKKLCKDKETLAKYIDSLLNFSEQFTEREA